MNQSIVFLSSFLLASNVMASQNVDSASALSPTRPNVVLFLVDDMGPFDTSVPFHSEKLWQNDFFKTPNMERLAQRGVMFTRAYACAVCSPSRVSLMTGMNAARHRVTNWTLMWGKTTDNQPTINGITLPDWNYNAISTQPNVPNTIYAPNCLPQRLKAAGYRTIHIGKAHFGANQPPEGYTTAHNPLSIGFDVNIGGWAGGGTQTYYPPYQKGWGGQYGLPNMKQYESILGKDGTHLTEALTLEAKKQISISTQQYKTQPFFLYMSHYAVHTPFEMDVRYASDFKDDVSHNGGTKAYSSLVKGMDKSLGDLMDYLDSEKLTDQTVIIFMADNGGYGLAPRQNANAPLSAGKGSAHEGGIRVPMILSVPNGLKNQKNVTPMIIEDLFPTILEIANVDLSQLPDSQRDGKSLLSELDVNRPLFFHFPNRWGEQGSGNLKKPNLGYGPFSAVVQGDWKYIYYHEPERLPREELFNLQSDVGEKNNLITQEKTRLVEMRRTLSDYLRSVDAQMPVLQKTKQSIPYPDQL